MSDPGKRRKSTRRRRAEKEGGGQGGTAAHFSKEDGEEGAGKGAGFSAKAEFHMQ